jgi:hypothetical protein
MPSTSPKLTASILGNQEPGGITEPTVRRLMLLRGNMAPAQIISLLDIGGATLAMPDHADHIHVGFEPIVDESKQLGERTLAVLQPGQWSDLISPLDEIENPVVPSEPSRYALPAAGANRPKDVNEGESPHVSRRSST